MSDQDYPSGPWVGFYVYSFKNQNRHRMDLALNFAAGRVTGSGTDDLGRFGIRGKFDIKGGEVYWHKTYARPDLGKVFYRGFREGKFIWGTWSLTFTTGGFKIWPLSEGTELDLIENEAKTQPAVEPVQKPKILIPSAVK